MNFPKIVVREDMPKDEVRLVPSTPVLVAVPRGMMREPQIVTETLADGHAVKIKVTVRYPPREALTTITGGENER